MAISYTPQEWCGIIADWLQDNRDAWCQGAMAVDQRGFGTDANNPGAKAFCTMGLLERFVWDNQARNQCVKLLSRALTPFREGALIRSNRSPVSYNDRAGRTVGDIIQMFRCASYMPDVAECEPHEILDEACESLYTKAFAESMKSINSAVPAPTVFPSKQGMSLAAKLGLVSWDQIKTEVREAIAA